MTYHRTPAKILQLCIEHAPLKQTSYSKEGCWHKISPIHVSRNATWPAVTPALWLTLKIPVSVVLCIYKHHGHILSPPKTWQCKLLYRLQFKDYQHPILHPSLQMTQQKHSMKTWTLFSLLPVSDSNQSYSPLSRLVPGSRKRILPPDWRVSLQSEPQRLQQLLLLSLPRQSLACPCEANIACKCQFHRIPH